jgi:hypothetical protein
VIVTVALPSPATVETPHGSGHDLAVDAAEPSLGLAGADRPGHDRDVDAGAAGQLGDREGSVQADDLDEVQPPLERRGHVAATHVH